MTKHARLSSAGVVMEVCCHDPAVCFHPDIASMFVEVTEDAEPGDTIVDGVAVKPEPEPEPELPPRENKKITREQFNGCLTRAERVGLKTLASTDAEVEDLLDQLVATNHVDIDEEENTTLFARLVTDGAMSQASLDKIYAFRDI